MEEPKPGLAGGGGAVSEVKLYLGDCLEILPTLASPVDAIITDLPYGTTACSWDVVIPFAPMWEQVKRLLKPNGAFVTTASQPFTSMLVMSNLAWFKYEWIWLKSHSANFQSSKVQPLKNHENVVVFGKNGITYNPQMEKGTFVQKRIGQLTNKMSKAGAIGTPKIRANVLSNTYYPITPIYFSCGKRADSLHPTQKPLALYEYLILTYTNPGDTVLDFCFGSGTTGVACVKTGRNFIGCEISPDYYAIAERRIKEAQLQIPMPLVCQ